MVIWNRSLQNQHYESHRPKTSVESLREKGQPVRLTTSEWIDHDPFVDQSTIYNVGIGTVRIRKRSRSRKRPQSYHQEVQFRLALWFKVYGISVIIDRQFGLPQIILQPLRLVPGNSPIMKACAMGNTEEVRCLITTKEASPWDTTPDDVTPLHIAAAWLRPETCKLLLDFGAETATAIRFRSISWYVWYLQLSIRADNQGLRLLLLANRQVITGFGFSLILSHYVRNLKMALLGCVKQCVSFWMVVRANYILAIFQENQESGMGQDLLCTDFVALPKTING